MSAVVTAFTPAADCFAPTYTVAPLGNDTIVQLTAIRGYATECYESAPEATGYPTASGIQCPSGYDHLTLWDSSNGSSSYGTCCPSGYNVQSTLTSMCSSVTGYNYVTVVNASATSTAHANFLWAPALVMSWQSGEMTTPAPTPAPTVATSATSSSNTTPLATNGEYHGSSGEHTVSLAVGISLGVVAAVLCAVGAFVGWWRYRGAKRSNILSNHGKIETLPETKRYTKSQYDTASEGSNRSTESLPAYVEGSIVYPEEKKKQEP